MSEHITHIAVLEDTVRLIVHSDAFDEVFKQALVDHYDSALCMSASRGNHLFAVPLLEEVRERCSLRSEMTASDRLLLAAALGWLIHRATDNVLDNEQELRLAQLREREGLSETNFYIDEHQIYTDALLFREVYDGGRRASRSPYEPVSPATLARHMDAHPGANTVDVEQVEALFGAFWQRKLLHLQQFSCQEDDVEQWMETFLERYQDYGEDLRRYVEAFQNPDPEKMRYYIDALNMYDASDPIIQLARALQTGASPPSSIELNDAVAASEEQSAYAKALGASYRNVEAAVDYFEGRLDKEGLYDHVGIVEHNRY